MRSAGFSLGSRITYVGIDKIGLTAAIPEASAYQLVVGEAALGLAALRRRLARP